MTSRVTVRGGRKLERFIADFERFASDPQKQAEIMAKVVRRVVLPALRAAVPRRTGRLRQSIRVVARDGVVDILGVFYGAFIRIGPRRQTLPELALDIIARNRPLIRAELGEAIKRELRI